MTFAARVVQALGPGLRGMGGEQLVDLVEALTSQVEQTDEITTPAARLWPPVFDLETTPYPRTLGAATGTVVPFGLTLEQQRDYVAERPAQRRGTPRALEAAVRDALIGGRTVELIERDGSPWQLTVRVYLAELGPGGATAVLAAALTQKPYGLVIRVEVANGASYRHMTEHHGDTLADFADAFPNYAAATSHAAEETCD